MSACSCHTAPIVHIMPKEKFAPGFVLFTDESFPECNVRFILYGSDDATGYRDVGSNSVVSVGDWRQVTRDPRARNLLAESSMIVLNYVHGWLLASMLRYRKKIQLLFWGGDLYPSIRMLEEGVGDAEMRWRTRLLQFAIPRVQGVITLLPGELGVIEKLGVTCRAWHMGAICGVTQERIERSKRMISRCMEAGGKPSSPMRIVVGNRATPANRHEAVLKALSRFVDEDICVYAPLSYGSPAYRDEVVKLGRELLGSKFVPITEYLGMAEYEELLSTMTVGVFNCTRQVGMGNIAILLRTGAKVYVSPDSCMLEDLREAGCVVESAEDLLACESFEELSRVRVEDQRANMEAKSLERFREEAVSLWSAIYATAR